MWENYAMLLLEVLVVILIWWEVQRSRRLDKQTKLEKEKTAKIEKKLNLGCDYCEEVKKLYPTPDNEFYLCKLCMEGYFVEHPEITEDQKAKIRAKYRVAKAAKRRKK